MNHRKLFVGFYQKHPSTFLPRLSLTRRHRGTKSRHLLGEILPVSLISQKSTTEEQSRGSVHVHTMLFSTINLDLYLKKLRRYIRRLHRRTVDEDHKKMINTKRHTQLPMTLKIEKETNPTYSLCVEKGQKSKLHPRKTKAGAESRKQGSAGGKTRQMLPMPTSLLNELNDFREKEAQNESAPIVKGRIVDSLGKQKYCCDFKICCKNATVFVD